MSLWNTTFDQTSDWTAVSFQQMFWQALIERQQTLPYQTPTFLPAGGADVGYGGTAGPTSTTSKFSAAYLQNWIQVYAGFFANPALVGTGDYTTEWGWTLPALYAAAGLNASGFTRKYPRELATLTAALYTDGSAFASGQNARCVANGIIYTRTSGAWVVAVPGTPPDTVTAYGTMQPGDYIGPWIWNELRNAFNQLVKPVVTGQGSGPYWEGDTGPGSILNPSPPTPAAAYAASAALYAYGATLTPTPGYIAPTGVLVGPGYPTGHYECPIYAAAFYATNPAAPPFAASVSVYGYVVGYSLTDASFDAQGDTVTKDQWNLFGTDNSTASEPYVSTVCVGHNPIATPPPHYDSSGTTWLGWMVRQAYLVFDYGVSGGFQYTSST